MVDRPLRSRARPVTLVSEQSTQVNLKRERDGEVWRAALANKKAAWKVNRAIREADRHAHIRMRITSCTSRSHPPHPDTADAQDPPPQPLQDWYRTPTPMHLGPDPRDRTGEGVWRNGMYFSGGYSPVEGQEARDLSQFPDGDEESSREQPSEINAATARHTGLRAVAPEPPPHPRDEEMPYFPQGLASFDERVSAIEWTLLAKIREMTPSGADADRIEVLEKFLLQAENQGHGLVSDRLIKLEAAVNTIEDIRRFGPRTFY